MSRPGPTLSFNSSSVYVCCVYGIPPSLLADDTEAVHQLCDWVASRIRRLHPKESGIL